jgi:general L-amino acid transport system permease protein
MTGPMTDASSSMTALPTSPSRLPGPPPSGAGGVVAWLRRRLFQSWWSTAVTFTLGYLVLRAVFGFVEWAIINAVWTLPLTAQRQPDTTLCQEARGIGACWAVIAEKYRLILFGRYPYAEQWRPAVCIGLFLALYVASALRALWRRELALIWVVMLVVIGTLMWGGVLGLRFVPQDLWGGLPITLILATSGLAFAFPFAILVALGRRAAGLPAVRLLCILYVELVRGVPLISLLFMASVLFPLFLPVGIEIDKVLRAQIAIILFAAAYLAEVVRGGLQSLPREQYEAADALGLSYWQKMGLIVLPQALRRVIPPLVGTFIGIFKDTSLVLIIGIVDLLYSGKMAMAEPTWQAFATEIYLFMAVIYFVFCCAMSRYSRKLERELGRSQLR